MTGLTRATVYVMRLAALYVQRESAALKRAFPEAQNPPRLVAIYLASTACNLNNAVIAEALGISRQYVHKAVRQVEDRRDDPIWNAVITDLQNALTDGCHGI